MRSNQQRSSCIRNGEAARYTRTPGGEQAWELPGPGATRLGSCRSGGSRPMSRRPLGTRSRIHRSTWRGPREPVRGAGRRTRRAPHPVRRAPHSARRRANRHRRLSRRPADARRSDAPTLAPRERPTPASAERFDGASAWWRRIWFSQALPTCNGDGGQWFREQTDFLRALTRS